jgi:SAM-dependent methyltransferase
MFILPNPFYKFCLWGRKSSLDQAARWWYNVWLAHSTHGAVMSRDYLDSLHREYTAPTPDRQIDQKVMGWIAERILPTLSGDRCLELGVGDAVWTPQLLEQFRQVVSIDGSKTLLDRVAAEVRNPRWGAVHAMFEEYRPAVPVDCVVATFVLEHVTDPLALLRLAREHWLRPSGTLVVTVPNALSLHRRLAVRMGMQTHPGQLGDTDRRVGHQHCFSTFEMERLLLEAGYRIVERSGFFTKLLPYAGLTHCTDQQLRGMFDLAMDLPMEYASIVYFRAVA